MNTYYYVEIPLEGTRWENLTFGKYYNMQNAERQEFREYLESINAPFGYELPYDDDDCLAGVEFLTWMDIVSFSDKELEKYKWYLEMRNGEIGGNRIQRLSYDGDNWAGTYDPETKVMTGGAWFGRKFIDNDFNITEVDEENVQDALKFCASLYLDYVPSGIAMSFKELKNTYEEKNRMQAELHSSEECF